MTVFNKCNSVHLLLSDLFEVEIPHYIWKPTGLTDSFISYINNCLYICSQLLEWMINYYYLLILYVCDGIKFHWSVAVACLTKVGRGIRECLKFQLWLFSSTLHFDK